MVEELGAHEVVDLGRPLVVSGDDVAEPLAGRALEVAGRVEAAQPGGHVTRLGRGLGGVAEHLAQSHRPELGDQ